MARERVECSRCGETFESQDALMLHSVERHVGEGIGGRASVSRNGSASGDGNGGLERAQVDELLAAIEDQGASDNLQVRYGQRFLAVAALGILAIALALTYLHVTGILDTVVYMFGLGTLFGLALSLLQAFLQAAV